MASNKSEKIKLYIVIGLAFVAAIVAYFRFLHKKNGPEVTAATAPLQEVQSYVSQIQKIRPKKRPAKEPVFHETSNSQIRDIFSPVRMAVVSKAPDPGVKAPPEMPALELKGTIMGGRVPMAIINDQFVRRGEKIGVFQIVKIDANVVVLRSGNQKKVLQVIGPGGKL